MTLRTLILGFLFIPAFVLGDGPLVELRGKIIHVTDGDTVGILVGNETIKIRLEGIDAPESKQAFGTKSKEALAKLVAGKDTVVKKTGEDRYQRTLGTIYVGQTNVNEKMVADGWAWHFKKYSKDEELAKLEVKARESKLGLWVDPNPLAPWEFRDRQKEKARIEPTPSDLNPKEPSQKVPVAKRFWLNTSGNVRHNETCTYFNNTKRGRFCTASDGKACGKCGG